MHLKHVLIVALLALVPACTETAGPQQPVGSDVEDKPVGAEAPADLVAKSGNSGASIDGVTIAAVANLPETEKLIARHTGKIVVVDLWALW